MRSKNSIPACSLSTVFIVASVLLCVIDSKAEKNKTTHTDSSAVTPKITTVETPKPGSDTIQYHPEEITAEQLKAYMDNQTKFFLIDGRGADYYEGTIPGSVMIMEKEIELKKHLIPSDKKAKIVAFCAGKGCKSSERLCIKLMELGYVNVDNFPDGFPGWKEKGYPTIVPK